MAKIWKRFRKRGFTLVELLVVIAIIGILVSIVMPAITDALTRGKLTRMAANGRNLVQSLMAKETKDIYLSSASVWPRSGSSTDLEQGNFQFSCSTDYFAYLVTNDIMNVNYNFFAGPGVPAAPTEKKFTGEGDSKKGMNNAWCMSGDVGPGTDETCPVLLTKNLGYDSVPPGEKSGEDYKFLDDDLKIDSKNQIPQVFTGLPFQEKGFVFVTKGGAAFAPFKDDMQGQNFTNIYQVADYSNAVIRPAPGDGGVDSDS